MDISFVVPIYNVENYLDACISSILSQGDGAGIEVILVDDGSSDSCFSICDDWAMRDARIRVIHQENQGLSAARNAGIKVATGDYIWCIDSDDILSSDALAQVIAAVRDHGPDIIYGRFDLMSEDGSAFSVDPSDRFYPSSRLGSAEEALKLLVGNKLTSHAWRLIVRRSLYRNGKVQFPVGRTYEDFATTYRLVSGAQSIRFLDAVLVHYRQRPGSILHADLRRELIFLQDALWAFNKREDYISRERPKLYRDCLLGTCSWLSAYAWDLAGRLGDSRDEETLWFAVKRKLMKYIYRCGLFGVPLRVTVKTVLVKTNLARIIR